MDINALKARMQQLNSRGGGKKANDLLKPKDEHEYRMLPLPGSDDPFVTLFFHYELGEVMSVLCPKANYGEECSVCDFADLLKAWKNPEGEDKPERMRKADFEIFKKVQCKPRVFTPAVERGHEGEGAKWWGLTPTQTDTILSFCTDSDRLEACGLDPQNSDTAIKALNGVEKAFDLKVSLARPGEKGNTKSFPQVSINIKFKPSPLLADKKAQKELLASIKKIEEVYPRVSSAEVEKILKNYLNSGRPEAKADGGVEYGKKTAAKPNSKEVADKVGGRSIDDAFGDMIDDDNKKSS